VFTDVDAVPIGADFPRRIFEAVTSSGVMLVVIGSA
jgi:hypothetical protein